MTCEHHGPASVILASRHLGVESKECLNEAIDVHLTQSGTPPLARLSFDQPLDWPANPTYVSVVLPDGTNVGGVIAQLQRSADGAGWVTFTLDD